MGAGGLAVLAGIGIGIYAAATGQAGGAGAAADSKKPLVQKKPGEASIWAGTVREGLEGHAVQIQRAERARSGAQRGRGRAYGRV